MDVSVNCLTRRRVKSSDHLFELDKMILMKPSFPEKIYLKKGRVKYFAPVFPI